MKQFKLTYTMTMYVNGTDEDQVRDMFDNLTSQQLGEFAYDVTLNNVVEVQEK
jgi:hypothetical protein